MSGRIRILTAVPICDGHDAAINTINVELVRHGIEVVYLGYHRSVRDMVRAAIQEEVQAIGISSYNGGHIEFFTEVITQLKYKGAGHIKVFGGGGGTITPSDAKIMLRKGVDRIFFPGTSLHEMVDFVKASYSVRRQKKRLTLPSWGSELSRSNQTRVIGVAGPGGAGKTTLIDELVLRFLKNREEGNIAILSHDPSIKEGALLGDRAAMIYSQHDRVFMRSLATRGAAGGLAEDTKPWLTLLKKSGFELILIETVGVGQESVPFLKHPIDKTIFVLSPTYGSRLQLQKIAMLNSADVIAINKSDQAGAKTAYNEVAQRISTNGKPQKLFATIAGEHGNEGLDALYREIVS